MLGALIAQWMVNKYNTNVKSKSQSKVSTYKAFIMYSRWRLNLQILYFFVNTYTIYIVKTQTQYKPDKFMHTNLCTEQESNP
jgi:hypothetical protein